MGIKSIAAKIFAKIIHKKTQKWKNNPIETQEKVFKNLIQNAQNTVFGKNHQFEKIKNYEDFKNQIPIRDYEELKPYIEKIIAGETDVLWKGSPIYFAKTSGTTSGTKFIPITKDSISNHINSARNALLAYVYEKKNADFLNGKLIFLSGSPTLEKKGNILTGRLSGIVNHHVPNYLRKNQLPSYETNCIEDWEEKVDLVVEETKNRNMTLISGIPPWVQMYFDKLSEQKGKAIKEIFPNFNLFVYGGVNFEPYRKKLEESIGKKIDSIELFPASEGFFAYQDEQNDNGLLLLLKDGIFFEFVDMETYDSENPKRIMLKDVELNKNYALIINSNAGLWGYNIGDTIKFVSKNPYKIRVTGRTKHFISAFGEHVIGEEVDETITNIARKENLEIIEYHVAPQVNPKENELPYHEWFIAFKSPNKVDLADFAKKMDDYLCKKNSYYKDLIDGKILQTLKIRPVQKDAFIKYMKSVGRLGGQNKFPRLANNRKIADKLI